MKVLIACEESQAVCKAFRALGHESYSCDTQECSGGHPEWHIMRDCLQILNGNCVFETADGETHCIRGRWDLVIAHPPCTYLTNAGSQLLRPGAGAYNVERLNAGFRAKEFFLACLNADCDRIAVENPVPNSIFRLPLYTQIIEPWQFGDPYTKKTCLWLKGLSPLVPTDIVKPIGSWNVIHRSPKKRSKTFEGIALAMAEQWGEVNI